MTDQQKRERQKQKWTYLLALEKLMDKIDLNPTGVMAVQFMMAVREYVQDLSEEDMERLRSSNPEELMILARKKGLVNSLEPVLKFEAEHRVDHNGQYRDYKFFEDRIAALTTDEPEFS